MLVLCEAKASSALPAYLRSGPFDAARGKHDFACKEDGYLRFIENAVAEGVAPFLCIFCARCGSVAGWPTCQESELAADLKAALAWERERTDEEAMLRELLLLVTRVRIYGDARSFRIATACLTPLSEKRSKSLTMVSSRNGFAERPPAFSAYQVE